VQGSLSRLTPEQMEIVEQALREVLDLPDA
jgi:hypothetical protein